MSGILERYGSTDLTLYNGTDDLPVGPLLGRHQGLLAGGAVGGWADQRRRSGLRTITKSGELIADSVTELQTLADAYRALAGTRDQLFVRMGDGSVRWLYADCDGVDMPRSAEHTLFLPVSFSFIPLDPYWRSTHHSGGWVLTNDAVNLGEGRVLGEGTSSIYPLTSGSPGNTTISVTNGGNVPATLIKVVIKAGDAPIATDVGAGYAVRLQSSDILGQIIRDGYFNLEWAGTIDAGAELVLDGESLAVENDHVGAYDGLAFNSNHTVDSWFLLPAGTIDVLISIYGGGTGAKATLVFDWAHA